MIERVEILGVSVDAVTMAQAVACVADLIAAGKPSLIATANAEMLLRATHDDELKTILNAANLVVPDGAGTVWAARHLGKFMPERVAGFDLVQELMKLAPAKSWKFFLFGAAPGIADKAKSKAETLCPGIKIVGTRNGYFTAADESDIIAQIKQSRADVLLAALGVPKQEKWLAAHLHELNVPVSIGVGGAPLWMQRARLEWLFRAMLQPSRAGRLLALPKFVLKVHRQKVNG